VPHRRAEARADLRRSLGGGEHVFGTLRPGSDGTGVRVPGAARSPCSWGFRAVALQQDLQSD
jgi:hypothetical protein